MTKLLNEPFPPRARQKTGLEGDRLRLLLPLRNNLNEGRRNDVPPRRPLDKVPRALRHGSSLLLLRRLRVQLPLHLPQAPPARPLKFILQVVRGDRLHLSDQVPHEGEERHHIRPRDGAAYTGPSTPYPSTT